MVSSYASPFLQMKHTRYLSLIRMLCCPAREPSALQERRLENEDRAGSSPHEAGTGCSESHDCRIPISGNFQEGRQRELGEAGNRLSLDVVAGYQPAISLPHSWWLDGYYKASKSA